MIVKEMEKIRAFDCKYAEGVETRTHRRLLYKTPVYGLHLETKGNHGIRDTEGEVFIYVYGEESSYILIYYTFMILSESCFHCKLKLTVSYLAKVSWLAR